MSPGVLALGGGSGSVLGSSAVGDTPTTQAHILYFPAKTASFSRSAFRLYHGLCNLLERVQAPRMTSYCSTSARPNVSSSCSDYFHLIFICSLLFFFLAGPPRCLPPSLSTLGIHFFFHLLFFVMSNLFFLFTQAGAWEAVACTSHLQCDAAEGT